MINYFLIFFIFISYSFNETKTSKIALIGAHDQKYDHIGKYAHLNKQNYAKKHGYDVFLYNENLDKSRMPYWSKIIALQKHLNDYEWLFWLDSDALIMNFNIKLETIIDNRYDFITTRDCLGSVNSGQFLIKNSPWSVQFLKAWFSLDNTQIPPGFDNGALIKLYRDFEEVRNHTKVLPQRILSSYLSYVCPYWHKIDGVYQEGDFVVHFACVSHEQKAEYMKQYFEKINR